MKIFFLSQFTVGVNLSDGVTAFLEWTSFFYRGIIFFKYMVGLNLAYISARTSISTSGRMYSGLLCELYLWKALESGTA